MAPRRKVKFAEPTPPDAVRMNFGFRLGRFMGLAVVFSDPVLLDGEPGTLCVTTDILGGMPRSKSIPMSFKSFKALVRAPFNFAESVDSGPGGIMEAAVAMQEVFDDVMNPRKGA